MTIRLRGSHDGTQSLLAPLREALLAAAATEADEARRRETTAASAALEAAYARFEAASRAAVDRGRARARPDAAGILAAAATQARAAALAAAALVHAQLSDEVSDRVASLRGAALEAGLRRAITDALGSDAVLAPSADGGVVGKGAGRRLDLSVRRLSAAAADRAAAGLDTLLVAPEDPASSEEGLPVRSS